MFERRCLSTFPYDALPAVNIASRLKDRARTGEILVTEPVTRKLGDARLDFEVVKVPVMLLKGKREPIDAYSIVVTPRREL